MRIAITGASGFLGRHTARIALDSGYEVLGLCRRPDPERFGKREAYDEILLDLPGIEPETTSRLEGADAMIHGAAAITGDPGTIDRVNVEGTKAILAAAPPGRFVFVSSMAVSEPGAGAYGRSKRDAEALVRAARPDAVILRPTMTFGRGDRLWTARIRDRVTTKRFLPLPRGGRSRIQPGAAKDVAGAFLKAATRPGIEGEVFELGGPELLPMIEFLDIAREALKGKTKFVPVPLILLRLAGLLRRSPFRDMAVFHGIDHPVDIEPARLKLGYAPASPREALPEALRDFMAD